MKQICILFVILFFSFSISIAQDTSNTTTDKKSETKKSDKKSDDKNKDNSKKTDETKKEKKTETKKQKTLEEYMKDLSADKNEKTIIEACEFIMKEKEKKAIPNLVKLIDDKRVNVRMYAVMALGYTADEKAVNAVNKVMLNDSSSLVRYAAILASFRIGSKKSLDTWKKVKAKETDKFIKDILAKMEAKARGK